MLSTCWIENLLRKEKKSVDEVFVSSGFHRDFKDYLITHDKQSLPNPSTDPPTQGDRPAQQSEGQAPAAQQQGVGHAAQEYSSFERRVIDEIAKGTRVYVDLEDFRKFTLRLRCQRSSSQTTIPDPTPFNDAAYFLELFWFR